MNETLQVIAAKILMLEALKVGPHSRTELTRKTRHYKPEVRQKAFNYLLNEQLVTGSIKVNIKPGRNPQLFKITDGGRKEHKRLVKEHR